MEKIKKEELMKNLSLTEEDLEKVVGGSERDDCFDIANSDYLTCCSSCKNKYEETDESRFECLYLCQKDLNGRKDYCYNLPK